MNWFINFENVVIKYSTRVWRIYLQQKYQNKNTLQGFGGNTYSKNSKYKEEFFLSLLYIKGLNIKMAAITKETYENNGIEVITDKIGELWLNERHIQKQLGLKNLPALTNKYDKEYKKQRSKLNESTKQSHRRFIHVDLALKVIMDCRIDESCKF